MTRPADFKEIVDAHLLEAVTIDELAIQEEYIRLPSDVAYWGAKYAQADKEYLMAKVVLDRLERQLYSVCRDELLRTEKRPTEALISSAIADSDEWLEAKEHLVECEYQRTLLKGSAEALRAKREVIISLGAHLRLEMMRDPVLRDQVKDARERAREPGF